MSHDSEPFLLRQPLWYADAPTPNDRWDMAKLDEDPQENGATQPRKNFPMPEDRTIAEIGRPWIRVAEIPTLGTPEADERNRFVQIAISDLSRWRRVGLVCGAGLGKTANLRWLEHRINRLDEGRNKNLAIFWELHELAKKQNDDEIKKGVVEWLKVRNERKDAVADSVERMLREGRTTFLLDSLDQAGPAPTGDVVKAIKNLTTGRWKNCRIWVSGRPYAFREAQPVLSAIDPQNPWEFFRVGPLDDPEACQLIECIAEGRK